MGVMRRKNFLLLFLALIVGLFVKSDYAGCRPARLQVVASIVPLGDFCREVGGDKVEVQVLIPPGASPHLFEFSPRMLSTLTKARVLVFVGSGLEPWLEKFLKARQDKTPMVVEASHGIELITEISGHAGAAVPSAPPQGKEVGHAHESGNPHIWLDPILVQDICRRIAGAFIRLDPDNKAVYEQNLERYVEKLAQLNQEIKAATDTFRIREFVGFHPSFTYFARRYNLKEVGIIEVAPGREPTPRAFKNILQAIQRYGIRVIFSEPQFSPRIAEVLAKEAGISVLQLDPIGGRPPYNDNYIQMMQYNLAIMAKAMR